MKIKPAYIICFLAFGLCACAQNMERRLDDVRDVYSMGDYAAASEKFSGAKNIPKQDNLELLITADGLFHENEFAASDRAYEEFNRRALDLTGGDFWREAGAIVGGNMANDYRPYMMDALFVSYYQIWDALADDRPDDARVVINQSYDRQQKMSREYEKLIEENQKAGAENEKLAENLKNENSQWTAFRDIMNPALTYLSGIYFLNAGKFEDAKTYLKRASGMMPENKFIKSDLESAKSSQIPSGMSWVFIESGFAPKLREKRFSMPWPAGNKIIIVSIAVSEPVFFNNSAHIDSSQLLADIDAMFMTEYGEYRVNEALRAWGSAVAKAVLQATLYNSNNKYSGLMGLAATAYSMASASAEVRTWATLPKSIYLLRVKKDKSGLIELKSGDNLIAEVKVPQTGNHLVYVRLGGNTYDAKVIKIK
ncbi:MAG: hypothetical protein LBD50_01550 [Rickettsiales bacterium]|jgi:hypothetical protein|nr:hypothetical protein [Rickettsiales bacterium]